MCLLLGLLFSFFIMHVIIKQKLVGHLIPKHKLSGIIFELGELAIPNFMAKKFQGK